MGPHEIAHSLIRWMHVIAGIMWIGHLYFFNFVNANLAKTYDADTKKKVVPELMPRALYMFRWGAAWTWITGVLLLVLAFYMVGLTSDSKPALAMGIGIAAIVLGPVVYDQLWGKLKPEQHKIGIWTSFVVVILIAGLFSCVAEMKERAIWIHIGALFGTTMAFNVWMRIWPAQKRIIGAIKGGTAPDAADVARAGLRSKHNTYMSVPLVAMMLNQHMSFIFGVGKGLDVIPVALTILAGWGFVYWMYEKAGKPEVNSID